MNQIIDNFSLNAAAYAAFRPDSPQKLFEYLYSRVNNFKTAWDCGTGNGQVAAKLAERFSTVYASDISQEQLNLAKQKENIVYFLERAETTKIASDSIDLITVAQALHWFDFSAFYAEVERVARPGAIIAAWTYSNLHITPEIDDIVNFLYTEITGKYWDKERHYVEMEYKTIPFPFTEFSCPEIHITKFWTIEQLTGYLRTWSGVRHFIQKEGKDPIDQIMRHLQIAWGQQKFLEVRWPVHTRIGKIK